MADSTKTVVALLDGVRHTDADGNVHEEVKGAKFEITASEFKRLTTEPESGPGVARDPAWEPAVGSPKSAEAKDAKAEAADVAAPDQAGNAPDSGK